MKRMAEAKQEYDNFTIPEELSQRVMLEINKAELKHKRQAENRKGYYFMKKGIAMAVMAAVTILAVGVNTSPIFAQGVNNIPILGELARVLTIQTYEKETDDLRIAVDIPSIEIIAEDLQGVEKAANEDIYVFCEQYVDEAKERARQYKQAFLETGGTEEEWAAHDLAIKVWYEIKSQTDDYLSLTVRGTENWNSADQMVRYYNLDLATGQWVTLQDVLGDDYIQIVNQNILAQIEKKKSTSDVEYWTADWQGIDEKTNFYMNQNGNPVVVLEKYTIAPGAAGEQLFEIPRK